MRKRIEKPGVAPAVPRGQQGMAKKRVFRFYDGEYQQWQVRAERDGLSLTAWLRTAAEIALKR